MVPFDTQLTALLNVHPLPLSTPSGVSRHLLLRTAVVVDNNNKRKGAGAGEWGSSVGY